MPLPSALLILGGRWRLRASLPLDPQALEGDGHRAKGKHRRAKGPTRSNNLDVTGERTHANMHAHTHTHTYGYAY